MSGSNNHLESKRVEQDSVARLHGGGKRKLSNVPGFARLDLNRRRIMRNREIQACYQCRSRKTKCDQSKPRCQKCLAHHRTCSYQASDAEIGDLFDPFKKSDPPPINDQPASPYEGAPQKMDATVRLNQLGHLRAGNNIQSRYYSSLSWMTATENFEVTTPLSGEEISSDVTGSCELASPPGYVQRHVNIPAENLDAFLQNHEVDYLISWYSNHCHFWHPIFDIFKITKSLHTFRRQQKAPPTFLAQVAAICYTATCSITASGELRSPSLTPASTWRNMTELFLSLSDYPLRPCLDTVRAAYLLATPSSAEENAFLDPGPLCVLLRVAQSLGLHRDPSSFGLPRCEADLKRVLWWSIHALEVSYSVSHALPPIVHHGTFDVKVINSEGRSYRKLISTISRVSVVMSKILYEIYGTRQPIYAVIRKLGEEAAQTCTDEAEDHQLPHIAALDRFIDLSQRMCCSKMVYILHQPFLRSTQWPRDSRPRAIRACQDYIEAFLASFTDPALTCYRWVLNHFNAIHPCAILLQDLIQNPLSAESTTIRVTVEACFSTLSTDLHYNLMRLSTLRSKAWATNQWIPEESMASASVLDASLSDWDPLFASLMWDDFSLQGI
ncbi:hypothetical protein N7509_003941 [Penicillium cosmopolitanum]|uniref:Zn(2)-C6 fungal-type domain-containing protein n=1 Tax=Penicillium cosmopolitanum TaxID=1131564 RepID=A0A9W9W5Z2_9EURO|nr:uncharacterized protein N7509_003941 [Penicillium cosmopolitanum]KAJ5404070.1 hypothetical protein N7509_003941 [Penicillium cosmopolitanum]